MEVSTQSENVLYNEYEKRDVFIDERNSGFNDINVIQFKQFRNLEIEKLNRINLFAGTNNSGKSSILELVYLLVKQNDTDAFFEVQRKRGQFNNLSIKYVRDEFDTNYNIEGIFNNKNCKYKAIALKEDKKYIINAFDYSQTIAIITQFDEKRLESKAQIYKKQTRTSSLELKWICNAMLSSPFSSQSISNLVYCHEKSIEIGIYNDILGFIQKYIDNDIESISFVGATNRFLVKHKNFEKSVDLTRFGVGVQRIFHISLQLAASTNGVFCIDEIDNAIHHSLFNKFVKFISELAIKFNVQLFITSHNSEFLDAFFSKNVDENLISAYRLEKSTNQVNIKYVSGEKYSILRKNFNQDLRG